MMRIIYLLFFSLLIIACKKSSENLMTVSGTIKGLKKGTVYLQKIQDSTLTNLDSLEIKGDGNFSFDHEVESPEIFYLYLSKADNNDINDRITFFGEPGKISITTTWNGFDSDAIVSGSKSQKEFEACKNMLSEFDKKELEIVQKRLTPEIQSDSSMMDSLVRLSEHNLIRRYTYVLNYALTNSDSYVSPYLALTEVADANPKYLDSINKSLSSEVANSKYGKVLDEYVKTLQQ